MTIKCKYDRWFSGLEKNPKDLASQEIASSCSAMETLTIIKDNDEGIQEGFKRCD